MNYRLSDNEQKKISLASGQIASVMEQVATMARSNYDQKTCEDGALQLVDMFPDPSSADKMVDLFKNIYNRRDLTPSHSNSLDVLIENILDIARENPIDDARIIIRDRLLKDVEAAIRNE